MRPKIAECVSPREWEVYTKIRAAIEALPPILKVPAFILGQRMPLDVAESKTIPNCHAIAHALTRYFPVEAHDGVLVEHRKCDDANGKLHAHWHSWLTVVGGNPKVIIDAWPLGVVSGPTIAVQEYGFRYQELTPEERQKVLPHFFDEQFNLARLAVQVALKKILCNKT